MDYLITDRSVVPPSFATEGCSEKQVYLPFTYQVNSHKSATKAPPRGTSRENLGLHMASVVLACMHRLHKLSPSLFDIVGNLLARLDHAILWLLQEAPAAAARLQRELYARGVGGLEQRLATSRFVGRREHWKRLGAADLFLDAFPHNAHSTATDALWAGLPLVTAAHEVFASRVAGSLLQANGVTGASVASHKEYEDLAIALAA